MFRFGVDSPLSLRERVRVRGRPVKQAQCPHPPYPINMALPEGEGAAFCRKNAQTNLGHALTVEDNLALCE